MGEPKYKHVRVCLKWLLMLSLSPLALLVFILMALYSLLRFLSKVALLSIIVIINTPFAVMYNLSVLVFQYHGGRFRRSSPTHWNWSDPRASLGIEIKLMVSDFLKVVAGELLVIVSTAVITYFTAPHYVFYISLTVGVGVVIHKWLNTDCLSKTALSCLCDGYGLSPLMFLFSFIGLFDIGCHPVAKCSFAARRAFLFVEDGPNPSDKNVRFVRCDIEEKPDQSDEVDGKEGSKDDVFEGVTIIEIPQSSNIFSEEVPERSNKEQDRTKSKETEGPSLDPEPSLPPPENRLFESRVEVGDRNPDEKEGPSVVPEPSVPPTQVQLYESRVIPPPQNRLSENLVQIDDLNLDEKEGPVSAPALFVPRPQNRLFENLVQIDDLNLDEKEGPRPVPKLFVPRPQTRLFEPVFERPRGFPNQPSNVDHIGVNIKPGDMEFYAGDAGDRWHPFKEATIDPEHQFVEFLEWNAFERGLFQLNAKVDFIIREYAGKPRCILKSCMVLKLLGVKLCEYPVDRLELPENFSKVNELFNFLVTLSEDDGFVTDKMRGRYEHSLTLLEIAEGVENNKGYKIVKPMDERFVVAGCTNL